MRKKSLAVLLTLVLVLSMSMTSFAWSTSGTSAGYRYTVDARVPSIYSAYDIFTYGNADIPLEVVADLTVMNLSTLRQSSMTKRQNGTGAVNYTYSPGNGYAMGAAQFENKTSGITLVETPKLYVE